MVGKNLGRRHTLESRNNMSLAHRGNVHSSETRKKISISRSAPIGTTCVSEDGYVHVKTNKGWEKEHRVVAGANRDDGTVVHHLDGNRANNDLSNLQVFETTGEHSSHHSLELRK